MTFLPAQIRGRWFYFYLILDLSAARSSASRCMISAICRTIGISHCENSGGILGDLVAGPPVAVVHVLAPDLAIELIERIVMCCHIPRGLFAVRMYHRISRPA